MNTTIRTDTNSQSRLLSHNSFRIAFVPWLIRKKRNVTREVAWRCSSRAKFARDQFNHRPKTGGGNDQPGIG